MKEQLLNKVENFLAKGEIASLEQIFFFSQCFQKSSAAESSTSSMCEYEVHVDNFISHF